MKHVRVQMLCPRDAKSTVHVLNGCILQSSCRSPRDVQHLKFAVMGIFGNRPRKAAHHAAVAGDGIEMRELQATTSDSEQERRVRRVIRARMAPTKWKVKKIGHSLAGLPTGKEPMTAGSRLLGFRRTKVVTAVVRRAWGGCAGKQRDGGERLRRPPFILAIPVCEG